MKWSRKWLVAMLTAMLLLLATGSALADTLRFGTVDGAKSVNLRKSASSSSAWLGAYEEGTWLRITGESGNFYKVKTPDGKTGYMSMNYVYISAAAKGTIGIVDDAGYLNLRKSASKSSKSLGQYDDGTPCILLSQSGGWYHVSVDGKLGYFDASFIEKKYTTYSTDVATVTTKNGGSLRLRQGPGTGYSTVKSVKNGAYVMILQKGDGWWKVTVDGKIGYMDSSFLTDGVVRKGSTSSGSSSSGSSSSGSSSSGSSSGSKEPYGVVSNPGKNQKLYLRASASKDSKSLGSYGNGVKVTVLEYGSQWCKVKVDGKTGYMMTDYLTVYNVTSNPTMTVKHPDKTFVYLRSTAAQTSGNILVKVPHGKEVSVLVPGKTWTKVRYNGYTGYMMTRFLDD
ncbi:MAG: SH3 domain-containing protein [Clostridia bacterium]|nr:SH3 domain-containing protein [Clostridia bacterium]